ncbi:MAG: hypothetical protein JWM42_2139 [Burkholderia sp.]|nr:hypothetical protein [Burkholderia sp.]
MQDQVLDRYLAGLIDRIIKLIQTFVQAKTVGTATDSR